MASAYVSKATKQKLQNIEDLKINKKTNLFDHCLGGLSTDLYELQEQPADLFKQGTLIVIFADSQKSAKWTILKAFQNCSFTSSAAFVKYTKVSCHVFCLFFYKSYVVYLDYITGANRCSGIIICMIQGEHSRTVTGWLPQLKLPLNILFFFLMCKPNSSWSCVQCWLWSLVQGGANGGRFPVSKVCFLVCPSEVRDQSGVWV